jgi:hypothetical protein
MGRVNDISIEELDPVSCTFDDSPKKQISNNANLKEGITKLPKEIRNIVAGGLAGMVAKTVVAPVDRIKILYQISSAQFHIYNVPTAARKIIETEGLAALWKGNQATMIRVFPYSGIQFMVFDRIKTWFLHEQEREYRDQKAVDPTTKRPKWGMAPGESLIAGMIAGGVSVISTYPLDLTRAQLAVMRHKRQQKNRGFVGVLTDNYKQRVRIFVSGFLLGDAAQETMPTSHLCCVLLLSFFL